MASELPTQLNEVLREGYLCAREKKKWIREYVVLRYSGLSYYSDKGSADHNDPPRRRQDVRINRWAKTSEKKSKKALFEFVCGGETFEFYGEDKSESDSWIYALNTAAAFDKEKEDDRVFYDNALRSSEDKIDSLKKQLAESKDEYTKLKKTAEMLVEEKEQQFTQDADTIEEKDSALTHATEQVDRLERQLDGLMSSHQELLESSGVQHLHRTEELKDRLQVEVQQLQERVDTLEVEKRKALQVDVQSRLHSSEMKVQALSRALEQLTLKLKQLRRKMGLQEDEDVDQDDELEIVLHSGAAVSASTEQALKDQLTSKDMQLEQAKVELMQAQGDAERLEEETQSAKTSLKAAEKQLAEAKADVIKRKADSRELAQLKVDLAAKSAMLESYQSKDKEAFAQQDEILRLQSQLRQESNDKEAAVASARESGREEGENHVRMQMQGEVDALKKKLAASSSGDTDESEVQQIRDQLQLLELDNKDLQRKLDVKHHELASASNQVAGLQNDQAQTDEMIAEAQARMLEQQASALAQGDGKRPVSNKDVLESRLKRQQAEIITLKSQARKAQTQADVAGTRANAAESSLQALHQELAVTRKTLTHNKQQLDKLRSENQGLESTLHTTESALHAEERSFQQLSARATHVTPRVQAGESSVELQIQLSKRDRQVEELQTEVARLKRQLFG